MRAQSSDTKLSALGFGLGLGIDNFVARRRTGAKKGVIRSSKEALHLDLVSDFLGGF